MLHRTPAMLYFFALNKSKIIQLYYSPLINEIGIIPELLQIIAELTDSYFNEIIISTMKNKPEENKIFRLIESQLTKAA